MSINGKLLALVKYCNLMYTKLFVYHKKLGIDVEDISYTVEYAAEVGDISADNGCWWCFFLNPCSTGRE